MEENLSGYHVPVLYNEVLENMAIRPDGVYVDATFGGGGHSRGILERLGKDGRLFAFDQDPDAEQNLPDDPRIQFVPHNFRHISRFLRLYRVDKVDGVLADLGVSSHQFDEAERGFSIRFDGDLDMRMDQRQPKKASDIVAEYEEKKLHSIFEKYGEVTNAKTLARTIVEARKLTPMKTISQFMQALRPVAKGNPNKYFAQVFQALRMEVNDEIGVLKEFLQQLPDVVKPGGRASIITFHSIEDRVVKQFFKKGNVAEDVVENPFEMVETEKSPWKAVHKKPITASQEELKRNTRSRSAKLRVVERIF
ncbi:16S rRNA (cytosine(1402)-N(4))-methyltransferase RsmH [Parasegetibacter sp. NRK P23]|uniref:16S rRNA (cytosine(1402)-N(4))-methyltransferase RsmH n=1 Tax=Parasegetibacter sp. NRK P23 TaxID=2942999 RepID=UPI002042BE0B|nr:16S rRNA (cytosine(1402)-N(4))-methyltransferase RsmH [Parasegetibacter sp. NRK P23]MCM5527469.1 16S rRNA (cytosine(1402)-N(4))-methyltransferase RsmH [Parasegetibacter sp. NRK P23]